MTLIIIIIIIEHRAYLKERAELKAANATAEDEHDSEGVEDEDEHLDDSPPLPMIGTFVSKKNLSDMDHRYDDDDG